MSTKSTLQNHKTLLMLFFFLITSIGNAQIGIGTTTPDATSIVDITSTTKGMLAPRMTTIQRNAITTPAQGLLVYDTDLKSFYYFSTPSGWLPLLNSSVGRTNFKRVKSAADLAPELLAGGSVYLLNTNTLYEINGSITLAAPINLNDAYVTGVDTNEDILTFPGGTIFQGTTGGSIRNVTLRGGRAFNITGGTSLFVQNTIVDGQTTGTAGTIANVGLYFGNIIQFINNIGGMTYTSISNLLLSNQAWFSSNTGTFETFTGIFGQIQKNSGFSQVGAGAIGIDVSSNPSITGDAVLESVVFSGANSAGYIKPYTSGTYTGYNFNNSWNVRCAGIPTESDANAVGDFAIDGGIGGGVSTNLGSGNPSAIVKIAGNSTSYNLFRFSTDSGISNRLKYLGKKKRIFQISGSVSVQVSNTAIYAIYIAKNSTALNQYKIYGKGNPPLLSTDIIVLPINASIELSNNDYIEIGVQRANSSSGDVVVPNMAITIK
ncbi:hypothetical protein [Flavobacterium sp. SLB02]|uniref:hypothetical protein n=1 Tax=Flavobacterium sp. SLB02 TaxID=2665645 RepID=UPI0012A79A66|nr:hypothetical protein [Flavobacterium sp. SLB02]QGK74451.1 hypothetical protein GIY83_10420 [Flavobacterium sp. SLB02]